MRPSCYVRISDEASRQTWPGRSADERRAVRHERSRPLVTALEPWLREKLALISQKSRLAEAIRYALSRWTGLRLFLADGRIELDTNVVRNALFAGRESGARTWAILASLINTAKLNDLDPQTYLADVLERMISGRTPVSRLDELLAWHWKAARDALAPAAA